MDWSHDSERRNVRWPRTTAGALLLTVAVLSPADAVPALGAPRAAAVRVAIEAVSGARQDIVPLPVRLESGGEEVAAVDVVFALPDGGVELLRNGRGDPACAVNRAIGKGSSVFRFLPNGCGGESGPPCRALRALILSLYDVDPIPDGPLFSCRVRITAEELGLVPVACERASAGSPDQRLLAVDCAGGGVIVQSVATPTPTFTPTRTWTAPPSSSPTPAPTVRVRIGTAAGGPGDRVEVPVRLSATAPVVGALIDVVVPNGGAEFASTGVGVPDCVVNPQIHKDDTAFAFQPPGCTPGVDCTAVRAIVLSFRDAEPIPGDVELFSCRLRIASGAAGVVPIVCGAAQTSPPQPGLQLADAYVTTCGGGGIVVNSAPTSTPTPSATVRPTRSASATHTSAPTEVPTATATISPTTTASPTEPPPPTSTDTPPPSATATDTPSPTHTASPPPSATSTGTATATATPPRCLGDCDGDGHVSVAELVRGVAIALGAQPFTQCRALDRNGDAAIAVDELITAVNAALAGCPSAGAGAA